MDNWLKKYAAGEDPTRPTNDGTRVAPKVLPLSKEQIRNNLEMNRKQGLRDIVSTLPSSQSSIAPYIPQQGEQKRMNGMQQAFRIGRHNPIHNFVESEHTQKAIENVAMPMLDIQMGMAAGKLAKPFIKESAKALGKYLTEETALKNTYNLFPENTFNGYSKLKTANNSYRVAGLDALEDFQNTGVLRSVQQSLPEGASLSERAMSRPTGFPSFQKGYADLRYLPEEGGVIFETGLPTYKRGDINPVTGKQIRGRHYAHRVINPETGGAFSEIPATNVKAFEAKPDWLKGHKEIPKSKNTSSNILSEPQIISRGPENPTGIRMHDKGYQAPATGELAPTLTERPVDSEAQKVWESFFKDRNNAGPIPNAKPSLLGKVKTIFKNYTVDASKPSVDGQKWLSEWNNSPININKRNSYLEPVNPNIDYAGDIFAPIKPNYIKDLYPYNDVSKTGIKNYWDLFKDDEAVNSLNPFEYQLSTGGLSIQNQPHVYVNNKVYGRNLAAKESVKVHELTHNFENNGLSFNDAENNALLKPFGRKTNSEFVPIDKHEAYFSEPTEVHARINQARYEHNLKPGQEFTEEMYDASMKKNKLNGMGKYIKDRKQMLDLFNNFYTAPVALGTTAVALDKKKFGGKLLADGGDPTLVKDKKVGDLINTVESLSATPIIYNFKNSVKDVYKKGCPKGVGCSEQATDYAQTITKLPRSSYAPSDAGYRDATANLIGMKNIFDQDGIQKTKANSNDKGWKYPTGKELKNWKAGDIVTLDAGNDVYFPYNAPKGMTEKNNSGVTHNGVIMGFSGEDGMPIIKHGFATGPDKGVSKEEKLGKDGRLESLGHGKYAIKSVWRPKEISDDDKVVKARPVIEKATDIAEGLKSTTSNKSFYLKSNSEPISPLQEFSGANNRRKTKENLVKNFNDKALDKDLQYKLGISAQDLNNLKPVVYGLFGQESNFNDVDNPKRSLKEVIGNFIGGNSRGGAQIKFSSLTPEERKVIGLTKESQLDNDDMAYKAAIVMLSNSKKRMDSRVEKGVHPDLVGKDEFFRAAYDYNSPKLARDSKSKLGLDKKSYPDKLMHQANDLGVHVDFEGTETLAPVTVHSVIKGKKNTKFREKENGAWLTKYK